MKEKVEKIVNKVGKKKGKMVKLEKEPEGTKAVKLDNKLKVAMEEISGADLSKVRIHTGGNIKDVAKEVGSKSFAVGEKIFFASKPSPEVVAHELAHVIQQGKGRVPKPTKGKATVS